MSTDVPRTPIRLRLIVNPDVAERARTSTSDAIARTIAPAVMRCVSADLRDMIVLDEDIAGDPISQAVLARADELGVLCDIPDPDRPSTRIYRLAMNADGVIRGQIEHP